MFFQNFSGAGFWDTDELESTFKEHGFTVKLQIIEQKEERLIMEEKALRLRITHGPVKWHFKSICFRAILK